MKLLEKLRALSEQRNALHTEKTTKYKCVSKSGSSDTWGVDLRGDFFRDGSSFSHDEVKNLADWIYSMLNKEDN